MNVLLWYLGIAFFYVLDHLPSLRTRGAVARLEWQREFAMRQMWLALDDLETRGSEISARARLYTALTQGDLS